MTTITAAVAAPAPRPLPARVLAVARLQLASPWTAVGIPVGILSLIFALNYVLFRILSSRLEEGGEGLVLLTGGVLFVYIYTLIIAVTSVNQTFALAIGFGATRREFVAGTGLYFAAAGTAISVIIATAAEIETATDGWGVPFQFFALRGVGIDSWGGVFAFSLLMLALSFAIGFTTAAVYVRWRARGMYVFWITLSLLLIGVVAIIVTLDAWVAIGRFAVEVGALGLASTSLAITIPAAIVGYLILRRTVPPGA